MAELDLDLKLRFERILWSAGSYTRTNVKLAAFAGSMQRGSRSVTELTDVDVLGVRFLDDLTPRLTAVDCKSGQRVSVMGRVFWLRGVMEHLRAERGYTVLSREVPEAQRESAAKLSVTIVHERHLNDIASRYPQVPANLKIGNKEAHTYLEGNLTSLPRRLGKLLDYRNTGYWYYTSARAISQAIAITRQSAGDIDLQNKWHKALLLDISTLYAISVLSLAGELISLMPSDVLDGVRILFFEGLEGVERRQIMIRRLQSILEKVTAQAQLPLNGVEVFQLDPPYLPGLADALTRVMARPIDAAEIPRYLKVRLIHGVLYDEWDLGQLLGEQYSVLADKLASDIGLSFMSACGFDTRQSALLGFR